MTLLLPLLDVEVQVPELNGSVVEAAEEVGLVEPEAEDETFAAIAAQSRLLVAPHLTPEKKFSREDRSECFSFSSSNKLLTIASNKRGYSTPTYNSVLMASKWKLEWPRVPETAS